MRYSAKEIPFQLLPLRSGIADTHLKTLEHFGLPPVPWILEQEKKDQALQVQFEDHCLLRLYTGE